MEDKRNPEPYAIPLIGKDEMNLVEFAFGPISSTTSKTWEVEHTAYDRYLNRYVSRELTITGADKFGLPRPVDGEVLVGMKALTLESGFASPKVEFSRYHLCQTIGWQPDGRAYRRLEESFDRIAGTTLKFKNSWYDQADKEFKSKTFHLITEVDLCSRSQYDRRRQASGETRQKLCSFNWTDVIWKSFQDGFIRTLDMQLFRKIAQGRRREVPLRLFRILDKRFWHGPVTHFKLDRLCVGTLGLSKNYSPAQMLRIVERAVMWLTDCEYLSDWWYTNERGGLKVYFRKREAEKQRKALARKRGMESTWLDQIGIESFQHDALKQWLIRQSEEELSNGETAALDACFGSGLERDIVREERTKKIPVLSGGRIRQEFVRRYLESKAEPRL